MTVGERLDRRMLGLSIAMTACCCLPALPVYLWAKGRLSGRVTTALVAGWVVLVALLWVAGANHDEVDGGRKSAGSPSVAVSVQPTPSSEPPAPSAVADPPAPTELSTSAGAGSGPPRMLASLQVRPRHAPHRYQRDAFGESWSDVDHNGCNQRDDVLLRDAVRGSVTTGRQGACDHDVLAGTWIDPYTGKRIVLTDAKQPAQAQAVQIDHIVPLAEAWASGADDWSKDRRVQFANDLGELLAVDGPTNESKGDGDPAAWRPRKAFQCSYATRWITVKARWGLSVDASEVAALRSMLVYC